MLRKFRWLTIAIALFFAPELISVFLWHSNFLGSPIVYGLPYEAAESVPNQQYDTCHPLGLQAAASFVFTKRLQKQFAAGTPESKVKKELLSQGFVDFDTLAIVTAPDYWQQRKNGYIPPRSDAETDQEVADQISEAKLRKTKMRKGLTLYPGFFSTEHNSWFVSWTLDDRNNIAKIHGCYSSFWRSL